MFWPDIFLAKIANEDDKSFSSEIRKISNSTKNQEVLALYRRFFVTKVKIQEEHGYQGLEEVIQKYGILYVLTFSDRFKYEDPNEYLNSQEMLKNIVKQMLSKSQEHFPNQSKRINKFIESLKGLEKLFGWEINLPQIFFDLCFKPRRDEINFDYLYNLPHGALGYLKEWQLSFMGYNNDLVKLHKTKDELSFALAEFEFTQFERELAYLLVVQLCEYSNENFVRGVAEIRSRCEMLNVRSEEVIFETQGAIKALASTNRSPLVCKMLRAIRLVSKKILPTEKSEKVVHYVQKLYLLEKLFESIENPQIMHNLLIRSYLGLAISEDVAVIKQLSKENRKILGFWQFKLVGYYSELGFFELQGDDCIKSALIEMGGKGFSARFSLGALNVAIDKLGEDFEYQYF